jgi:hypothetical protein
MNSMNTSLRDVSCEMSVERDPSRLCEIAIDNVWLQYRSLRRQPQPRYGGRFGINR